MRYLAALTALGLLASTAAYAQNSQGTDQSSSSSQATSAANGTQALSHPFVRQIQMRLRQQGVYDGKLSGTWDDTTAKAVQDFQQQNNIQPTGQIDGPTIVALLRPANEMAGEGSSTPQGAAGGGSPAVPMVAIPMMRVYERGYQQGFAQGLRWAQQQEEQQQQ